MFSVTSVNPRFAILFYWCSYAWVHRVTVATLSA